MQKMSTGESKDDREKRVAKLWETLDARKEGRLNLKTLKRNLKKIDHRKRSISDLTYPVRADD